MTNRRRRGPERVRVAPVLISIHAPREGSDSTPPQRVVQGPYFNPRPPRGERLQLLQPVGGLKQFQSTPPERGATWDGIKFRAPDGHFNPRPPRGERRRVAVVSGQFWLISIHAPERGATTLIRYRYIAVENFNPRPREGSDPPKKFPARALLISIHAPERGATQSA